MVEGLLDIKYRVSRAEEVCTYDKPMTSLDERLQNGQLRAQNEVWDRYQESSILRKDDITYEIHGVYHTPDPATWRHSRRRQEISMEADIACRYPSNLVFSEQELLGVCRRT